MGKAPEEPVSEEATESPAEEDVPVQEAPPPPVRESEYLQLREQLLSTAQELGAENPLARYFQLLAWRLDERLPDISRLWLFHLRTTLSAELGENTSAFESALAATCLLEIDPSVRAMFLIQIADNLLRQGKWMSAAYTCRLALQCSTLSDSDRLSLWSGFIRGKMWIDPISTESQIRDLIQTYPDETVFPALGVLASSIQLLHQGRLEEAIEALDSNQETTNRNESARVWGLELLALLLSEVGLYEREGVIIGQIIHLAQTDDRRAAAIGRLVELGERPFGVAAPRTQQTVTVEALGLLVRVARRRIEHDRLGPAPPQAGERSEGGPQHAAVRHGRIPPASAMGR